VKVSFFVLFFRRKEHLKFAFHQFGQVTNKALRFITTKEDS